MRLLMMMQQRTHSRKSRECHPGKLRDCPRASVESCTPQGVFSSYITSKHVVVAGEGRVACTSLLLIVRTRSRIDDSHRQTCNRCRRDT